MSNHAPPQLRQWSICSSPPGPSRSFCIRTSIQTGQEREVVFTGNFSQSGRSRVRKPLEILSRRREPCPPHLGNDHPCHPTYHDDHYTPDHHHSPKPVAPKISLPARCRKMLQSWTQQYTQASHRRQRAQILLLADQELSNTRIAEKMNLNRNTVRKWRDRTSRRGGHRRVHFAVECTASFNIRPI